ncbi:DUF805 domain-containing protein [Devosia sp.]|uniref:DUF805 domain-containing protein n=1 Tax=Devosia sp. TaxID=1871048 RepID=UPI003BA84E29
MLGYFDALLRYFEFSGRTSRTQYWMFQLTMTALIVGAVLAEAKLTGRVPRAEDMGFPTLFAVIFHTVPSITVTVRRLHDSGRSGWWYLIGMVPLIGSIWLLVLMCAGPDGVGMNGYGEDPRYHAPGLTRTPIAALPNRAQMLLQQIGQRTA